MKHPLSRIIFAVLISTLAIGSVSPTSTVQAAPPAERVYFSMEVVNPKTTLRCGQTVTYVVRVGLAQSMGAPTPAPGSLGLPKGIGTVNVKVEAFSVNKNVGDFVATEKGFATAETFVSVADDDELMGLAAAKFKFKANKPGKTTLHFEGLVGKEYVSTKLDVKVESCKFKTTTIGEWHVPGPANLHIVAISDDAEVKADEQGNLTGSTTVNWAETATGVGNCPPPVRIERGSSRVDWHGEMDDSGQLTLEGAYLPSQGSYTVSCGVSGTFPVQLTPDPLQVSVAISGGAIRKSQVLQGPEATTGYVTIIVVPDEDDAVSFIPGNQAASRDDFFSLFGALLALP